MSESPNDAIAFRWRDGELQPIAQPQQLPLSALLHIDRQKAELVANTRQFVTGHPANHALLSGARGTGKSSLVKAMLSEFSRGGLRLVEVSAPDLVRLHDVVRPLRARRERYVLYVDDFSVAANDPGLAALKGALDGDIETAPDNVLIYATSNRRHLMPEFHSENAEYRWIEGELHAGESTEEKISLSERFGLWLSFPAFNQDEYLALVEHHVLALGGRMSEEARAESLRWSLTRASRSGRVAMQFARDWVGKSRSCA
ncbi:MAG TPA: ATP-binding protein [Verrucomicrobiae bacterium]|nr:ATP-binding protein [Verrucomicrobiae bacterium]